MFRTLRLTLVMPLLVFCLALVIIGTCAEVVAKDLLRFIDKDVSRK